jgi:hypothetical protein
MKTKKSTFVAFLYVNNNGKIKQIEAKVFWIDRGIDGTEGQRGAERGIEEASDTKNQ